MPRHERIFRGPGHSGWMECWYPVDLAQSRVLVALWIMTIFCCMATVVQEKRVMSCNTPCDVLQLTCPRRHRIAIREANFSVNTRDASTPCSLTHSCGAETLCCERTPLQNCVFRYSLSHLEAVHRNCSGTRACAVKTERATEETVQCPFFNPNLMVSHTELDYFCINDSANVDVCAVTETERVGRTLFALLDSRRGRQLPERGAVCRCTAESVTWPTTNTIAVFIVDMRLNAVRSSLCSKADVSLRSGSRVRQLDCVTSRDPRVAVPFEALLNDSNVATVELFLHHDLPEFIWLGFESNELEDIRLTCGLQGYVPIFHDEEEILVTATGDSDPGAGKQYGKGDQTAKPMPVGALTGASVGGVLLCVVVVAAVVVFILHRRRHRQLKSDDYSEPHDVIDDVDIYYSTPDVNLPAARNTNSKARKDASKEAKPDTARSTQDPDDGEVYVTAEVVRERKRQSGKKKVRIVSVPDISNDVAAYYASPWDIRDRRRLEEEKERAPPLATPTDTARVKGGADDDNDDDGSEGEEYSVLVTDARFARIRPRSSVEASYDHLSLTQNKRPVFTAGEGTVTDSSSSKGVETCATVVSNGRVKDCGDYDVARTCKDDTDGDSNSEGCADEVFSQNGRQEPDGCNHNAAFEEDDSPT